MSKIKILIFSPPFSGHLNPIVEMVNEIKKNDKYDIVFYTGENKINFLKESGYRAKSIFENKLNVFEDIVNTSKKHKIMGHYKQFKKSINIIPEMLDSIEKIIDKENSDIVISDYIMIPVGVICNNKKIPWITSLPTPFLIESKNSTPSYLGGLYPKDNIFYKIRDEVGRKIIRLFKKIIVYILNKKYPKLKYKLYNKKNEENIYSPYSILALGMKELEFRNDFPKQLSWTGPMINTKPNLINNEISKISENKKVFITIGTHLWWGKERLLEIASELSKSFKNIDFIVSLGDFNKKNLPIQKVEDNIYVFQYIDYNSVLSEIDYVIHHGGAGILNSCILYKKPSVIIPHDYDQFDFAVRAEITQVGVRANINSFKSIKKALKKIMEKENWDKLNELSNKILQYRKESILENEINRVFNNYKK